MVGASTTAPPDVVVTLQVSFAFVPEPRVTSRVYGVEVPAPVIPSIWTVSPGFTVRGNAAMIAPATEPCGVVRAFGTPPTAFRVIGTLNPSGVIVLEVRRVLRTAFVTSVNV
jgi:hypothetical protein